MDTTTVSNTLLIATLVSVLLGILVLVFGKIRCWFQYRDKKAINGAGVKEEALSIRAASEVSESEIGVMIRANQETNTKIGKLYEMVESLDKSGSKGSARMLEKFDLKLEGFATQLKEFDKQLVRLDTIVHMSQKTP